MRVLFISQPNKYKQKPDFPPIGVAYLGAIAHAKGHQVLLLDSGLTGMKDVIKQTKEFNPDFIGVSCFTINREMVWKLCEILQEISPEAFLAVGGPHASIYPEHIFIKTKAKAVIVGEGEETISELLNALQNGNGLSRVNGIVFRNKNGGIERTRPREQIQDLDKISFPFYEGFKKFNFKNYGGLACLPKPTAPIITSRGCVFDCTYCGSVNFWGKRWRCRSAQNVLDEIEFLVKKFKVRSIYIFDDNFPVNKKRALDICEGFIERELNIQWACCSHIKMINEELLNAMKRSGCVSIDFGVESGSDVILENINKKQTSKDIEYAFALTHKAGIKPRAYLMVGNKGETVSTIDETIEMTKIIRPYSSIGATLLWLLPGTRVFEEAKEKGFISDNYWLEHDDVPYNLQEYSYQELFNLRQRLMKGISKQKGGMVPAINYWLKSFYYRFPFFSRLRSLIPGWMR